MANGAGRVRRGSACYFRVRVPRDLVDVFGKPEIKESLKTKDHAEAKKRRNERALYWQARFDRLREEIADEDKRKAVSIDQLNAIFSISDSSK